MSLGWAGNDLQRSASSEFKVSLIVGCFSLLHICRFTLNLCGLIICIEVTHLKDATLTQGCAVVVIYLHVALLRRSLVLNLRWSRMHRRSLAPPKCANASPPPLCTCSRCSCPPENKENVWNPELVKYCTESVGHFCLQRVNWQIYWSYQPCTCFISLFWSFLALRQL